MTPEEFLILWAVCVALANLSLALTPSRGKMLFNLRKTALQGAALGTVVAVGIAVITILLKKYGF